MQYPMVTEDKDSIWNVRQHEEEPKTARFGPPKKPKKTKSIYYPFFLDPEVMTN